MITAAVVGDDQICEGDAATYKIQLDQVVSVDTWFTVQVTDGTANRVDRNDYEAAHQDIMWGGYYDYRYGIGGPLASIVDNRISNGTYSGTDRPTVGPDGAAIWDYTVQKGGAVQSGGTVQVLVRAGQSMSESFEIQTWNERVTVDNDSDFTRQNGGYREYTETFSMAITQASSCDSIQVESSARMISILDKTQYESFSPIALDLNGDGRIGVTGESTVKDADRNAIGRTVSFDIDADGKLDQIEWFSGDGDGILVNTAYIGANG